LLPKDGQIDVRRIDVSPDLLDRYAASGDRTNWWLARLKRVHALL
jgi:O-succinylbenzoate synthase